MVSKRGSSKKENEGSPIILVAEPQLVLRQKMKTLLAEAGYGVLLCEDGPKAVEAVYQARPSLVLASITLPHVTGYQVCRLIKNDPAIQSIPVLLCLESQEPSETEASSEKLNTFWGYKAGADGFFPHTHRLLNEPDAGQALLDLVKTTLTLYQKLSAEPQAPSTMEHAAPLEPLIPVRLNQILDKSLIEATLMNEFRKLTDLCHDVSLLNHLLFSLMESILDYDLLAIFYNEPTRDPRLVTFHVPEGKALPAAAVEPLKQAFFARLSVSVLPRATEDHPANTAIAEVIGTVDEAAPFKEEILTQFDHGSLHECHAAMGTREPAGLIGAVMIVSKNPSVDFERIFPYHLILSELNHLMKVRYLYGQAFVRSITDGWTGLFNHRYFMRVLEQEYQRSRRYGLPLTLAMLDLDHLRQFNQDWGFSAGDEILRHIANLTLISFRTVDVVARSASEELYILFPETELEMAQVACQRFLTRLAETPLEWSGETISPTVSIGLAEAGEDCPSLSQLLHDAETALRLAKERGCNRIELSTRSG
jgi:diguanylate cyclase (GGDEF)-like protein